MVRITTTPPVAPPFGQKNQVAPVERPSDERQPAHPKPKTFVERRKKKDRREDGQSSRGAYDMRSGRDRRKRNQDGPPSIEVDV